MCYSSFPEGYILLDKIDLQHNKKQFWLLQGIALILVIVMFAVGYFIDNFSFLGGLQNERGSVEYLIALAVLVVGYIAYIIAHEATHGVVMRLSVNAKLNFGFKGWAAYAGSTGYFDKKHYIAVALAPLIIWGIVFGVLNIFFHSGIWFWVIWVLQIGNVSGAAGDLFCTYKMFTYPKDILVRDSGMDMLVFRRKTDEELKAEKEIESSANAENEEITVD